MTVYKISERLRNQAISGFAGIIFDCDGVLIDASRSYGATLEICARSFAALLGFKFEKRDFERTARAIQSLGTFNNDWDTLAVFVAFCYSQSSERQDLDSISLINPLSKRLVEFERRSIESSKNEKLAKLGFSKLDKTLSKTKTGMRREDIVKMIFSNEEELSRRFEKAVSYPEPVGKGLLATFFDEIIYGERIFRETYGIPCSTRFLSKPGTISNERTLAQEQSMALLSEMSSGNLGIITGRPEVPTIHTLGELFRNFFPNPGICLFTGDYMLDVEEVKPSPKPMLKIANALKDKQSPILYVGDSAEDILMVKRSNSRDLLDGRIMFAGVAQDESKAKFFLQEGNEADCITSSVDEMAVALKTSEEVNPK